MPARESEKDKAIVEAMRIKDKRVKDLEAEVAKLREALAKTADQFHRTIRPSDKHRPGMRPWYRCDCFTCWDAATALGYRGSRGKKSP